MFVLGRSKYDKSEYVTRYEPFAKCNLRLQPTYSEHQLQKGSGLPLSTGSRSFRQGSVRIISPSLQSIRDSYLFHRM